MENLKIEVEETKTYWERMKWAYLYPVILWTAGLIILLLLSHTNSLFKDFIVPFLIFIPFIAITVWSSDLVCVYYITFLEIKENNLYIIYKKRNKNFEINDSLDKFEFKKGDARAPNGQFGTYIKIIYKGDFLLRQYSYWNWKKEGAYHQTIDYLVTRKLLGKSSWVF